MACGYGLMEKPDHCRIGSLEMSDSLSKGVFLDHCRIGSLEMSDSLSKGVFLDHCRIGSLEMTAS